MAEADSAVAELCKAAMDRATSAIELAALARHESADVRAAVASNPALPADVQTQLSSDRDPDVRAALAGNRRVAPEVLQALSGDSNEVVAVALAKNRAAPQGVFTRLARRWWKDPGVTRALARNAAAPPSLLQRLSAHPRWDVRALAVRHACCPEKGWRKGLSDAEWAVRAAVASRPDLPPDVFENLVTSYATRPQVLFELADNRSAPPTAVRRLLRNSDSYIRGMAAGNPAAPAEQLEELASKMTEPPWVLRRVASNSACPPEVSERLLTWIALGGAGPGDATFNPKKCSGHPGDPSQPEWFFYYDLARQLGENSAVHSVLWKVRAQAPRARQRTLISSLQALARDPKTDVRRVAASFDALPKPFLAELQGDSDQRVRELAAASEVKKRTNPTVITGGRKTYRTPSRSWLGAALAAMAIMGMIDYSTSSSSTTKTPSLQQFLNGPEVKVLTPGVAGFDFFQTEAVPQGVNFRIAPNVQRLSDGATVAVGPLYGGNTLVRIQGVTQARTLGFTAVAGKARQVLRGVKVVPGVESEFMLSGLVAPTSIVVTDNFGVKFTLNVPSG
jgi:hypothetical protein